MSSVAVPTRAQPGAIFAIALRSFQALVAWYRHRQRVRRAETALMAMDDRLLTDLGIVRSEISRAVRGEIGLDPWAGTDWRRLVGGVERA